MKLKEWFNWAFPKPQIPQKRYLVIAGLVLYYLAKGYVAITPTPHDDSYPDKIRDAVIFMFANEETQPDPSSDYDKDGMRFGERE